MNKLLPLSLLIACLAGCGSNAPRVITNSAMEDHVEHEWSALLDKRASRHLQVIKEDKSAPPQHTQMATALIFLVKRCVLVSKRPERLDEESAKAIEIECAHRTIHEALVFSGPDRAYEASMAAKSIDPQWYLSVVPTHIAVD